MELLKVLGQGGISQVTRWRTAESAELVVRRLKTGMEEGRVKVVSVVKSRKDDTHVHSNSCVTYTVYAQQSTKELLFLKLILFLNRL